MSLIKVIAAIIRSGGGAPPPPPPSNAPTNFVGDNKNMRFYWSGGATVSDYEYRLLGGSPITCNANPQEFVPGNYAIGDVEVRLKAAGSAPASAWLSNPVAFSMVGVANVGKALFQAIGDSLTPAWGGEAAAALDTNEWDSAFVSGYSGAESPTIKAYLKQNLALGNSPSRSMQVIAINAGTNDFNNYGGNVSFLWNNYVDMCAQAHMMGWKVILVICGDTGTTGGVTSNHPNHAVWAAYARAHWQEIADELADIAADPYVGMMYPSSQGSLYSTDGTHYSTLGGQIAGQIVADAAARLRTKIFGLGDAVAGVAVSGNNLDWSSVDYRDVEYSPNGYDWSAVTSKPYSYPYRREANKHFLRLRKINHNSPSVPTGVAVKTGPDMASEAIPFYDGRWQETAFNHYYPHGWYTSNTAAWAKLHFTEGILLDGVMGAGFTVEIEGVPVPVTAYPFEWHDPNPATVNTVKECKIMPDGSGNLFIYGATIFG